MAELNMCFMVKASKKASKLAEKYGVKTDDVADAIRTVEEQLSAFDHPSLCIVTHGTLTSMRWGLIPHWTRDRESALEIQNKTINARSETAFEKASFRDPIRKHRCIIPVDAFYEWQHQGKDKIKYRLEPTQDEVFSLAGVWDEWVSPQQGKTVKTFSILTCEANPLMAEIHNTRQRMPVILGMESVVEWLNLELADQRIKELAQPCPEAWLRAIKAAG